MKINIKFVFVTVICCQNSRFYIKAEQQDASAAVETGGRGMGGRGKETQLFPHWHWHEDYAILDWRRKCAKYNIINNKKDYIIGGLEAERNMFPYLVGLLMFQATRLFQCGGSLISEQFVLTAAHCLYRTSKGRVYLGSYMYANIDNSTTSVYFNVTERNFIIYESYGGKNFKNDIALIRLPQRAQLSENIQIISLAKDFMLQSFLENEIVTTAGWGRIADNSTELNFKLYYVDTEVMSYDKCRCYFLPGLVNQRTHLCADGSMRRGGCDGDSGGPLSFVYKNKPYLVGVVAFGSAGGCEIGFPTVYSKITNYLEWISRKTGIGI